VKLSELSLNPALAITLFWRWVCITVCVISSIVVAYWIGTGQTFKLTICVAVVILAIVTAGFRDRAWVLIPVTWTLAGSSGYLPFSLSIHDVGILLAFCAYIGYSVLMPGNTRRKLVAVDWLLALNVIWLLVTFVRHPVGLHVFGAETMGARPYINLLLALFAYRAVLRLPNSVVTVSRVPYFILAGTIVIALINVIVYISPGATPYVYQFYTGVDPARYLRSPTNEAAFTRWENVAPFGITMVMIMCAAYPPRSLLNPTRLRFYLFMLGVAAVFAAGYRNVMLWVLVAFTLGSCFHQNWRDVVVGAIAGVILLGAALAGQGRLYELPLQAQRTLSFLPGKWSPLVAGDAESSTDSRFEWWRQIVKEHLIHDWWGGDGLGVSESDYNVFVSEGMTIQMFDWFALTGAFHNGPLTAIRSAGIIGLVLFYLYMIGAAVYSVKCVNRCRGTILFPLAVFLAIQLLWQPVHFTFVFGSYSDQIPQHIFLVGLLLLTFRMRDRLPSTTEPVTTPQALSRRSGQTLVPT
jgi:hypothetical protein